MANLREQFEEWAESGNGSYTDAWAAWQAATEAAKATGTAGELPPLKSINNDAGFWQKASNWAYSDEGDMMKIRAKKMTDYIDQRMREYGQACAEAVHRDWLELQKTEQRLQEAARQPAPVTLSDEQIFKIHDQINDADSQILAFARAIISATNRSQP